MTASVPKIPIAAVGERIADVRLNRVTVVVGHTPTGWPLRPSHGKRTPIVTTELAEWMESEQSLAVIAAHVGVGTDWVKKARRRQSQPASCVVCGSEFTPRRRNQNACSPGCSAVRKAEVHAAHNRRAAGSAGHGIDAQAERLGVSRRKLLATLAGLLGQLPLTMGDLDRLRIDLDRAE